MVYSPSPPGSWAIVCTVAGTQKGKVRDREGGRERDTERNEGAETNHQPSWPLIDFKLGWPINQFDACSVLYNFVGQ